MSWTPININEPTAANRVTPFGLKYALPRNGKHRLRLNDIANGDTFTLTYAAFAAFIGTEVTGAITGPATGGADISAGITTAINALTRIDTVSVVKVVGVQEYDVEYTGTSAATQIPIPTVQATGFTALATTRLQFGGPAGQPALGIVLATTDVQVTKNGGALAYADAAGSFVEIGNGVYHRIWSLAEVNTRGYLHGRVLVEDLQITDIKAWVDEPQLGGQVLYKGTVQAATANAIRFGTDAPVENNKLLGGQVFIYEGVGALQSFRQINAYNGDAASKEATIYPNFAIIPDTSSKVIVFAGAPGIDTSQLATTTDVRDAIVPSIVTHGAINTDDAAGRVSVRGSRGSL